MSFNITNLPSNYDSVLKAFYLLTCRSQSGETRTQLIALSITGEVVMDGLKQEEYTCKLRLELGSDKSNNYESISVRPCEGTYVILSLAQSVLLLDLVHK